MSSNTGNAYRNDADDSCINDFGVNVNVDDSDSDRGGLETLQSKGVKRRQKTLITEQFRSVQQDEEHDAQLIVREHNMTDDSDATADASSYTVSSNSDDNEDYDSIADTQWLSKSELRRTDATLQLGLSTLFDSDDSSGGDKDKADNSDGNSDNASDDDGNCNRDGSDDHECSDDSDSDRTGHTSHLPVPEKQVGGNQFNLARSGRIDNLSSSDDEISLLQQSSQSRGLGRRSQHSGSITRSGRPNLVLGTSSRRQKQDPKQVLKYNFRREDRLVGDGDAFVIRHFNRCWYCGLGARKFMVACQTCPFAVHSDCAVLMSQNKRNFWIDHRTLGRFYQCHFCRRDIKRKQSEENDQNLTGSIEKFIGEFHDAVGAFNRSVTDRSCVDDNLKASEDVALKENVSDVRIFVDSLISQSTFILNSYASHEPVTLVGFHKLYEGLLQFEHSVKELISANKENEVESIQPQPQVKSSAETLLNRTDLKYESSLKDALLIPDIQLAALLNQKSNVAFRCSRCFRVCRYEESQHQANSSFSYKASSNFCSDCARFPHNVERILDARVDDGKTIHIEDCQDKDNRNDSNSTRQLLLCDLEDLSASLDLAMFKFLVKFESVSYLHVEWCTYDWLRAVAPVKTRNFLRNHSNSTSFNVDIMLEKYTQIEKVLDVEFLGGIFPSNLVQYQLDENLARQSDIKRCLIKFKNLSYSDCTWEHNVEPESPCYDGFWRAYRRYLQGLYVHFPQSRYVPKPMLNDLSYKSIEITTQPQQLKGGQLMPYQLEGMNWLYYKYLKSSEGSGCILADEMGLGKTIQLISFITVLVKELQRGPFLIIVPQSLVSNWELEFQKWSPHLSVAALYGGKLQRSMIKKYEIEREDKVSIKCHVVILSKASVQAESQFIGSYFWDLIVVDEGQNLKSDTSMFVETVRKVACGFKIALTGTPFQNNVRELFNLMQFLDQDRFNAEQLEETFRNLDAKSVDEIHALLRNITLRRVKADVLEHLPSKVEVIVPLHMTPIQRRIYKQTLSKNIAVLEPILRERSLIQKKMYVNMNHIISSLRKCLIHPLVWSNTLSSFEFSAENSRAILADSAKLQFLALLLPALSSSGHRVLLFSQFLSQLDLIELLLEDLGFKFLRIDGSTSGQIRQREIDRFNSEEDIFAFLLTTRAGGVGINLAGADTVIICDPDYNPHMDIQAVSRAHRFGQTRKVLVLSLITKGTVEDKIMALAKRKRTLDHLLIQNMQNFELKDDEVTSILEHGLRALLVDEKMSNVLFDDAAVLELLKMRDSAYHKDQKDVVLDTGTVKSCLQFARVWEYDRITDNNVPFDEPAASELLKQLRNARETDQAENGAYSYSNNETQQHQEAEESSAEEEDQQQDDIHWRKRSQKAVISDSGSDVSSSAESQEYNFKSREESEYSDSENTGQSEMEEFDSDDDEYRENRSYYKPRRRLKKVKWRGNSQRQSSQIETSKRQSEQRRTSQRQHSSSERGPGRKRRRRIDNSDSADVNDYEDDNEANYYNDDSSGDEYIQKEAGRPKVDMESTGRYSTDLENTVRNGSDLESTVRNGNDRSPLNQSATERYSQILASDIREFSRNIRHDTAQKFVQKQLSQMSAISGRRTRCELCEYKHISGMCPLRYVPYEFCRLCGHAHTARQDKCTVLQTREGRERVLQALEFSVEDSATIAAARQMILSLQTV